MSRVRARPRHVVGLLDLRRAPSPTGSTSGSTTRSWPRWRLVSGQRPDVAPESVRTPDPAIVEPVRTPRRQTGDEALAELGITLPPPGTHLGNPFAD